jgi:hypothetical protein
MLHPDMPNSYSSAESYQLAQLQQQQAGALEGRNMGSMCPSESSAPISDPDLRQRVDGLVAQLRQLSGTVLQGAGDSGFTATTFSSTGGWPKAWLPCWLAAPSVRCALCRPLCLLQSWQLLASGVQSAPTCAAAGASLAEVSHASRYSRQQGQELDALGSLHAQQGNPSYLQQVYTYAPPAADVSCTAAGSAGSAAVAAQSVTPSHLAPE